MNRYIYDQWMDGDLTATAALRALCMNLGEVEDQLATLEQERNQLRNEIGIIVARLGESVTVKGFGTLSVSAPSKKESLSRFVFNEEAVVMTKKYHHLLIAAESWDTTLVFS